MSERTASIVDKEQTMLAKIHEIYMVWVSDDPSNRRQYNDLLVVWLYTRLIQIFQMGEDLRICAGYRKFRTKKNIKFSVSSGLWLERGNGNVVDIFSVLDSSYCYKPVIYSEEFEVYDTKKDLSLRYECVENRHKYGYSRLRKKEIKNKLDIKKMSKDFGQLWTDIDFQFQQNFQLQIFQAMFDREFPGPIQEVSRK